MSRVLVHHPCDAVSTNLSHGKFEAKFKKLVEADMPSDNTKLWCLSKRTEYAENFDRGKGCQYRSDSLRSDVTENFWSSKSKVDWRQQIKQPGNVQLPDLRIYHLSTSCPNESAHLKLILSDDSLRVMHWWCPVLHVPRRRSTPTTMSTMRSANSGSDDVCAFPKTKKAENFGQSQRPPCTCWKSTAASLHFCILLYQDQDTPNLCTTTCWYSSGAQRNCNIEATFAGADPSGWWKNISSLTKPPPPHPKGL